MIKRQFLNMYPFRAFPDSRQSNYSYGGNVNNQFQIRRAGSKLLNTDISNITGIIGISTVSGIGGVGDGSGEQFDESAGCLTVGRTSVGMGNSDTPGIANACGNTTIPYLNETVFGKFYKTGGIVEDVKPLPVGKYQIDISPNNSLYLQRPQLHRKNSCDNIGIQNKTDEFEHNDDIQHEQDQKCFEERKCNSKLRIIEGKDVKTNEFVRGTTYIFLPDGKSTDACFERILISSKKLRHANIQLYLAFKQFNFKRRVQNFEVIHV